MSKFFRINRWWIPFVGTFGFGLALIFTYCYFTNGYTIKNLSLGDWLNYVVCCGTVGGFLYLILDKIFSEKETAHQKWQSEIPFITLSSPCDPTLSYCDINLLENHSDIPERGIEYFALANLGKTNAYNISILFSPDEKFIESKIFNRHYVSFLVPLKVLSGSHSDKTDGSTYSYKIYEFKESIYSRYNVNPDTKEISNTQFDICGCLDNCNLSKNSQDEKYFYTRIIYYSSFDKNCRYKIQSTFKVHIICIEPQKEGDKKQLLIKGIALIDYSYKFEK